MQKLFGLLLALAALPMLFFNEGRAVSTAKSLEEGAAVVVHVEASPIKASHDGKLVHFTGAAVTASLLRDPIFGVEAKALQLSRKVEMYRWREQTASTRSTPSGNYESRNGYNYDKIWSEGVQSSQQFKNPNGHENPDSMPFEAAMLNARDVTVGDYQIPPRVISELNGGFLPWALDEKAVTAAPDAGGPGLGRPKLDMGGLYYGKNPADPQVGDLRVRFAVKGLDEISVIGRQRGNTVEPYPTKVGRPVEMAEMGSLDAAEMFDGAMKSNTVITWVVRIGGSLLMYLGTHLFFKVQGLMRFVPVIGSLLNAGTGLLAIGVASAVSLATISLAWIVYRPLLGLALLGMGGLIGFLVLRLARQKAGPAYATPPPPYPPAR